MLETVNSLLLEKGFRHAELPKTPSQATVVQPTKEAGAERESEPPTPEPSSSENAVQLKTVSGDLLATILMDDDSMRVVPAEDKNFDVNTPPFTQFLVERVLMKMQERDNELARAGQLEPDRIFSYNLVREDDMIREIGIKNVDADRLRELKSSIRWTLEKMFEKMKGQS